MVSQKKGDSKHSMSDLEWKIIQRKSELKASLEKSFVYNDQAQYEDIKVNKFNLEIVDAEEQSFLDIDTDLNYVRNDTPRGKYNSFAGPLATNGENHAIESLSKPYLILLVNELNLRN